VMSGVNPQGCDVSSFKSPSSEELDARLSLAHSQVHPGTRQNRHLQSLLLRGSPSVRVHPTFLKAQKLPDDLITKHIWDERYEDINSFERYLTRNGVGSANFFPQRFKKRTEKEIPRAPRRFEKKNWKFSWPTFWSVASGRIIRKPTKR